MTFAWQLSGLRDEAVRQLGKLHPAELASRIDQERKGGLSAGQPESNVRKTRSSPHPQLDRRDNELASTQRQYETTLRGIVNAIQLLVGIESQIGRTRPPTDDEKAQASDLGMDCLICCRPVACTPADRLRAGRCQACWQYWRRHDMAQDRPKDLWES